MIQETTSESPFPTSGAGLSGMSGMGASGTSATAAEAADSAHGTVSRAAQRAHEAVDRVEQAIGAGSERMLDWQQEYGDMAREQVRANPLAAVGVAFLAGLIFGRVFMR